MDLPFTKEEDEAIKTLSSTKCPTLLEFDKLHLEKFRHFRGREAIEARYLFLKETYQLNDQIARDVSFFIRLVHYFYSMFYRNASFPLPLVRMQTSMDILLLLQPVN